MNVKLIALLNKNLKAKSVSRCGALRSGLATLPLTFETSDLVSPAKYSIQNSSGDGGSSVCEDREVRQLQKPDFPITFIPTVYF